MQRWQTPKAKKCFAVQALLLGGCILGGVHFLHYILSKKRGGYIWNAVSQWINTYCSRFISTNVHQIIIHKVIVAFGSQTGTTEQFSQRLSCILSQRFLFSECFALDLENLDVDRLLNSDAKTLWIFCVATHGEGEPTDNARLFFKQLAKLRVEPRAFDHVNYAVLGFGNQDYDKFNWAAKTLDKRLQRLGATRFCTLGEADDRQDAELDALCWVNTVLCVALRTKTQEDHAQGYTRTNIQKTSPLYVEGDAHVPYPSTLPRVDQGVIDNARLMTVDKQKNFNRPEHLVVPSSRNAEFFFSCYFVPVSNIRELLLCPERAKCPSVSHVTLDLAKAYKMTNSEGYLNLYQHCSDELNSMVYEPTESVDILTPNDEQEVFWWTNRIYGSQGSNETRLYFENKHHACKAPFPSGCRVIDILRYFCDLTRYPTRQFLETIIWFMQDPVEKRRLKTLISLESKTLYEEVILKPMLNMREAVSLLCTSARFMDPRDDKHLIVFLYVFPKRIPRPYSVSSASGPDGSLLSLTVKKMIPTLCSSKENSNVLPSLTEVLQRLNSTLTTTVPLLSDSPKSFREKRKFFGNVSSGLCGKNVLTSPPFLRFRSSAPLPRFTTSCPILLIATGTGIAPIRSVWRYLNHHYLTDKSKFSSDSRVILIYGCTHPDVDFLYRDEITQLWDLDDTLQCSNLHPVFSHAFFAFSRVGRKEYVQNIIQKEMHLLVPNIVNYASSMIYICGSHAMEKQVSRTLAKLLSKRKIKEMKSNQRYIEEVWT